jgi:hypothetical protein
MGQHPGITDTSNTKYGSFSQPTQSPIAENADLKKKFTNGTLQLGSGTQFFQTTYGAFNGPKPISVNKPLNNKSFCSSLQIGGDNNQFSGVTSSGAVYIP